MTERVDGNFDVLVVGGGNAGVSTAARLLRRGVSDVAIIEPNEIHTYRPLLSYVGAGQATMKDAERTQRSVIPDKCRWIVDSVIAVDPETRIVRCASGRRFGYTDLVLGQGLSPDHDALPGIVETMNSVAASSNYLDTAERTWDLVVAMPAGGHAVFTVPRPPVACTGTTLKPLFLAAAHWQHVGLLPGISITLVLDRPSPLGVPDLDSVLLRQLDDLGVRVLVRTTVTELHPVDKRISVTDHEGTVEQIDYDLLHLVPPFRGPSWLEESGLTGSQPHGLVDVDPNTLRHRRHPTIWAAGDGAGVETDPSGGALRQQVSILVDNIVATRRGEPTTDYDGYSVAPVAVGSHSLIAAEFDRSGAVTSTLPSFLDPLKPRRSAWAFDRYVLPRTYFGLILRGRL